MPLVLNVRCSRCGFAVERRPEGITIVDLANGTEGICRHPGEVGEAEALTRCHRLLRGTLEAVVSGIS